MSQYFHSSLVALASPINKSKSFFLIQVKNIFNETVNAVNYLLADQLTDNNSYRMQQHALRACNT